MNKQARNVALERVASSWPTSDANAVEIASKLSDLVEAALDSNFGAVRQLGQALMMRCGGFSQPDIAARFQEILRGKTTGASGVQALPSNSRTRASLIEELRWPTTPLFLEVGQAKLLGRLVQEIQSADTLAKHGLSLRPSLLLEGPPGTGKTLAAGHLAARLNLPFYVVRLDAVVSSLLGDTARNVRTLFEFVEKRPGVLFLDEFDAIAKRRDDSKDVGELKRVVNALLQCQDLADPRTVVVAATNHADLLDSAVWRRFPYRIRFDMPSADLRATLWTHYLGAETSDFPASELALISGHMSCSDIAEVALAARRSALINGEELYLPGIVQAIVQIKDGGYALPDTTEIEGDEKKWLWLKLEEQFSLAPQDIASLWSMTRQNVEKQLKPLRRKGEDGARKPDPATKTRAHDPKGKGRR